MVSGSSFGVYGFGVKGLGLKSLRFKGVVFVGVYGFRVQGFTYSSTFQVPSSRIGTVQASIPHVKSYPKQRN